MMHTCCSIIKVCRGKNNSVDDDGNEDDALQLPAEDEVLLQKLREESRAVFLQRKSRELLDNEELQVNTHTHTHTLKGEIQKLRCYMVILQETATLLFSHLLLSFFRTCGSFSISTRCLLWVGRRPWSATKPTCRWGRRPGPSASK